VLNELIKMQKQLPDIQKFIHRKKGSKDSFGTLDNFLLQLMQVLEKMLAYDQERTRDDVKISFNSLFSNPTLTSAYSTTTPYTQRQSEVANNTN
jgi:hypothetical protein